MLTLFLEENYCEYQVSFCNPQAWFLTWYLNHTFGIWLNNSWPSCLQQTHVIQLILIAAKQTNNLFLNFYNRHRLRTTCASASILHVRAVCYLNILQLHHLIKSMSVKPCKTQFQTGKVCFTVVYIIFVSFWHKTQIVVISKSNMIIHQIIKAISRCMEYYIIKYVKNIIFILWQES